MRKGGNMTTISNFVEKAITEKPTLYAVNGGELSLINAYMKEAQHNEITQEQFKAIASVLRTRNAFLSQGVNADFDLRRRTLPKKQYYQMSIYDLLEDEAREQVPKIVKYFQKAPERVNYTQSRIKKSVRGIENNYIETSKVLLQIIEKHPIIKVKKETLKSLNNRAS